MARTSRALAAKVTWSDRGPLLDLSRQFMELLTWDRTDHIRYAMTDADIHWLAPHQPQVPRRIRLLVDFLAERFRAEPWKVRPASARPGSRPLP